ncbi:hypothetical protein ACBJ59_10505 [Nonomuraea sp. MTCD27]|uniref:hypothetical protein n=1 Tax=Nonomuraea sp. MTCD27 TaxID=1676747 RepID=UPI0035C02E9D
MDIPEDLIAAWRAFEAATAEVEQMLALLPTGADIATGKAGISEEPWVALAQAQARQHEATAALWAIRGRRR